MSCTNPQCQNQYSDNMSGQGMLNDFLNQRYPAQTFPTTQTMPRTQSVGSYQPTGGPYADVTSQVSPIVTTATTAPAATTAPTAPTAPIATTATTDLTSLLAPITPTTQPPAMTLESTQYLNGALRTLIGRKVTVSFLIGTNTYQDRSGTLVGVGANYIILQDATTNSVVFCDYYTIKFVTVY
jgi:hypothetical protein